MKGIDKIMQDEKIEYYKPLAFSDLKVTRSDLVYGLDFTPASTIIFLIPYYTGQCENFSAYAASQDYHIYLKQVGNRIVSYIQEVYGAKAAAFCDHSPIDERHAAAAAGLGIIGKSGLLINEKYGTYVFLGEVLTDIPPAALGAKAAQKIERCNNCGACISACPTCALSGGGECLSAITQKKGALTDGEADLLVKFNTVWGCDECQKACPYNKGVPKTPISFFYNGRINCLTKDLINGMCKQEFAKYAFAWRGKKTLLRNLEIFEGKGKGQS